MIDLLSQLLYPKKAQTIAREEFEESEEENLVQKTLYSFNKSYLKHLCRMKSFQILFNIFIEKEIEMEIQLT